MAIQLIVDSCCDSVPALERRLDLRVVPLRVQIGAGKEIIDDGSTSSRVILAQMSQKGERVRSSCPSPLDFKRFMGQGDCMVITLSGKLSGSYQSALIAKAMCAAEHPEQRVHVFDSKSASAGELKIAVAIREWEKQGKSFEEIVTLAGQMIAKMKTMFVLEDLGNLFRSGRLGKVTGAALSALSVRCILGDDGNGEVKLLGKAIGSARALLKLTDYVNQNTEGRPKRSVDLVLSQCNCMEKAARLKADLLRRCKAVRSVTVVPTSVVSTLYANNGGIVVAF